MKCKDQEDERKKFTHFSYAQHLMVKLRQMNPGPVVEMDERDKKAFKIKFLLFYRRTNFVEVKGD
jgi:hypothetical protein